jgi:hypothetical protein
MLQLPIGGILLSAGTSHIRIDKEGVEIAGPIVTITGVTMAALTAAQLVQVSSPTVAVISKTTDVNFGALTVT